MLKTILRLVATVLFVFAAAALTTACESLDDGAQSDTWSDSASTEEFGDEALYDENAPEIFELASTSRQIVYVNFDGVRVDDCENYCSDASTNRSWAIAEIWGQPAVTFAPYGGSSAARTAILEGLRSGYSDYNIEFTTTRPTSAPYQMLIISPTTGPHHGVAPLDCENRNPNDIAFVYRIASSSTGWITQAGAHELGHSFGLSHVVSAQDYMQWASSGSRFTVSNYDAGHPSGKCFSGDQQDAPALLRAALGLWAPEPVVFDGTFQDDDGNIHEQSIEKLVAAGITVGCAPGEAPKFCPMQPVTRGQMVVFLRRGLSLPSSSVDHFTDDNGAWYEAAANAAADRGITKGCGGTRFCGDEPITREQMASFLARAFSYPPASRDYFTDDETSIHQEDINRIAEAGVTVGCGGTSYCPTDQVTRDQMASFLVRALGL